MEQALVHTLSGTLQDQEQKSVVLNLETGINYQNVARRSDAFAALLRDAGCAEGDFICCMTQEPERALIAVMGIAKAGCVCVPISASATAEEIQQIMVQSNSNWLLTDESASACPDFLLFDTGEISLGWLGNADTVPQDISPEFLFRNIEQYTSGTPYAERNNSGLIQCMIMGGKSHIEELQFGINEIKAFSKSFDMALKSKHTGLTALFINDNLFRLFSAFISDVQKGRYDRVWLFSADLLKDVGKVTPSLEKVGATRIIVPGRSIGDWGSDVRIEFEKMANQSVKEVIVLGKIPTQLQKSILKSLFPQSKVKEFFLRGYLHKNGHSVDSTGKFGGTVNRIRRKSLEHWEKIFLGVVDEATFIQIRQAEFIRDMKAAYLNYWRKVEEENLLTNRHPIKLVLNNNI